MCVPKPGALHPGRIWPVVSKVARDPVFICSVSGTDRNFFKPEGFQCWVCFFASLSLFLTDLIMREKCAVNSSGAMCCKFREMKNL